MSKPVAQFTANPTLIQIFSYLERAELATNCSVCKDWKKHASHNMSWTQIIKPLFVHGEVPKTFNIKAFFDNLESQKLKSNQEILDRVQTFVNRVSLGQNAQFRCLPNSGLRRFKQVAICIEIRGSMDKIPPPNLDSVCADDLRVIDFRETCFAVNGIGDGYLPPLSPTCKKSFSRHSSLIKQRVTRIKGCNNFQATLHFPAIKGSDFRDRVALEDRITDILGNKIEELEKQQNQRYLKTAAFGGGAMAIYFINWYVNSSSPD